MSYLTDRVFLEIEPVYGHYSWNKDLLESVKVTGMRRTRPTSLHIELEVKVDRDLFVNTLRTALVVDVDSEIQVAQVKAVPIAVDDNDERES